MNDNNDLSIEYCISCFKNALPFSFENDKVFHQTNSLGLNDESNLQDLNCYLTKSEQKSIKQITNMILANSDPDNENQNFCKYYNIDQLIQKNSPIKESFQFFIRIFTPYNIILMT